MQRVGLGRQALVLFALGGFGCDQAVGDPARGLAQDVRRSDGVLTSRDAGIAAVVEAGKGEAGQAAGPVLAGAGPLPDQGSGSIEPSPTPANLACQTRFYRDLDGDGFGDARASVIACTQPPGFVPVAGDCYDQNDRARPGASGQFFAHRGDGSFDYDCDGLETPARTKFAVCPSVLGACPPNALDCDDTALRLGWEAAEDGGWTDFRIVPCLGELCPSDKTKVPGCGQAGYWGLSVAWDLRGVKYACTVPAAGTTRIQTCR